MLPYECGYLITHPIYFYAMCTDPIVGQDHLFVSNDHGDNFHRVCIFFQSHGRYYKMNKQSNKNK